MRGKTEKTPTAQVTAVETGDDRPLFESRTAFKPVQFLISPEVRKELRRIAFEEDRSMSEIVREAIDAYLAQRG